MKQKYKPVYIAGQVVQTIDGKDATLLGYLWVEVGCKERWNAKVEGEDGIQEVLLNAKRKYCKKVGGFNHD